MDGQQIYDNFHGNALGDGKLTGAAAQLNEIAGEYDALGDLVKDAAMTIEGSWTGQAGDAATRGAGPLAVEFIEASPHLQAAQELTHQQVEAFHRAAGSTQPVPPVPDKPSGWDNVTSGFQEVVTLGHAQTAVNDYDNAVAAHNQVAQRNVDAMDSYTGGSDERAGSMPSSYGSGTLTDSSDVSVHSNKQVSGGGYHPESLYSGGGTHTSAAGGHTATGGGHGGGSFSGGGGGIPSGGVPGGGTPGDGMPGGGAAGGGSVGAGPGGTGSGAGLGPGVPTSGTTASGAGPAAAGLGAGLGLGLGAGAAGARSSRSTGASDGSGFGPGAGPDAGAAGASSGGVAGRLPGGAASSGLVGEDATAARGFGTNAAGAPGARGGVGGMPMGGSRGRDEEDKEHQSAEYLQEADPDSAFGGDLPRTPPPVLGE